MAGSRDADAHSRIDWHTLQTRVMGTTATGPGYTTCKGCGAKRYLTSPGQLGVFPREG